MSDFFSLYGADVKKEHVRAVWAAVSADPRSSVREMARHLHIGISTVGKSLLILQRIGVIRYVRYRSRARVVVVPLLISSEIRIVQVPAKEMRHAA